ncbi:MAG TPA: NAD(P)-dependent oxidoreductase [Stellaceae bacterium]
MLPLVLDLARLKLVLVGNGAAAERRLALLDDAGAADLAIHADDPSPGLARAAGRRLLRRLPTSEELAAARIVFIAERGAPHARDLAATARAAGALVHVEDEPALCDLHAPAALRRGELLIAVSTGAQSPALAAQVKRFLGGLFGPEWQGRLDDLAALRRGWREGGADHETVARWTEEWVGRQGWLPADAGGDPRNSRGAPSEPSLAARH